MEFRRFNHEPYGAPDDQNQHGPARAFAKHDQGDLLRSIAEAVLQLIMEFERKKSIQWIDFSEE